MEIQIEKWKRSTAFRAIRFWVYGKSGVGKTRFAATWPKPLFLDVDKGMMSVDWQVDRIDINQWSDLQNAWRYLAKGEHSYETLVLDTVNEIQHLALQRVIQQFPGMKRSYENKATPGDYGKALDDFDSLIREFMKFDMHIVFISQVANKEFETDPVEPDLVGKKTSGKLARKMSVIGYMDRIVVSEEGVDQTVPVIRFNEQEMVSKDRTGVLPDTVASPTFDKLAVYWKRAESTDTSEEDR